MLNFSKTKILSIYLVFLFISIFSISNITHKHISFPLEDINLIENEFWYDLLSNESINYHAASVTMKPYQSLWITNYLSKPKI